jgi:hypothetical protein
MGANEYVSADDDRSFQDHPLFNHGSDVDGDFVLDAELRRVEVCQHSPHDLVALRSQLPWEESCPSGE